MIIKHKSHFIYLIVFMMLFLQGCDSGNFAKEQAEMLVSEGRPTLEEYVNSLSEEAHIINVSMINGGEQGEPSFHAKLPSSIVQATFLAGDKQYIAIVNLEDGEIYSNYDSVDPNEQIQKQLTKYCDEHGFRGTYSVSGAFYSYAFVSHRVEVKKGDVRDVYVYIDNIPDLAPVANGDEFMNASISGFDITYEAELDEIFAPGILYKYLTDTGNYRKENIRGDNGEYHISGGRREQNLVKDEPAYYEMKLVRDGNPDTMTCDVLRWDYKEEDEFCYFYMGGTKNGNVKSIEGEGYAEYNCPFAYEGNELTYIRDDNSPYEGYLYIKNPKWSEIVMTRYKLTNKSADENTKSVVDRWELEAYEKDELEAVKSDSANLFELYDKGTKNKCTFTDDKVIVSFK